MEKRTERDRLLLGYAPRDPSDFRDVFGGPPRRHSTIHESRHDSFDSQSLKERRSASRLLDKPVFAGGGGLLGSSCSSPARRSHLGDDFFSDIFPASDPSLPPPRKREPEPFPSSPSPSSRVLSPARPMTLAGGSPRPAHLSLSMNLAKGTDNPTSNSPTKPSLHRRNVRSPDTSGIPSSPSSIDDAKFNSFRQSPLPCEVFRDPDSEPSRISMDVLPGADRTSLEGFMKNGHFHFSIYKWASKGVTLIMPSNLKEKSKSGLGRLPEVVVQKVGLTSYDDDKPITTIPSERRSGNQDGKLLKDLIVERDDETTSTTVEGLLIGVIKSTSVRSDATVKSDAYSDNSTIDQRKPELKSLHQLFNDDLGKQGNDDMIRQPEEKEEYSKGGRTVCDDVSAKQQAGRESVMEHVEVDIPSIQDVRVPLEDKIHANRVKGKVKDFIKKFNNDVSPKRKDTFETQTRRSKVKNEIEGQVITSATKMTEDMKATSGTNKESSLETPIGMNKILKAEKPYFNKSPGIQVSKAERGDISEKLSESTPEVIEASECNIEESHSGDLDGCFVETVEQLSQVEQLSRDQKENLQTDSPQDQIKISDTRIRDWSKGKEGNIRSLLSTLQYVLWAESGWKPVPLVDIIEGTSVKKAYQKAMLCLHPDKLQQKGAAAHQKYIAEKVFDILQEAWDHFNSISSF